MSRLVATFLHKVGRSIVAKVVDPRWIPKIGSLLFNNRKKKSGVVTDVIGNVKKPYIVVKGEVVDKYYSDEKFLVRGDLDD